MRDVLTMLQGHFDLVEHAQLQLPGRAADRPLAALVAVVGREQRRDGLADYPGPGGAPESPLSYLAGVSASLGWGACARLWPSLPPRSLELPNEAKRLHSERKWCHDTPKHPPTCTSALHWPARKS